jgi:8-oxo-dGTP diphosphatase
VKRYVLGFAFNEAQTHVALIRKLRPDWQAGKWNGIGGHIEEGESPVEAMAREFNEEAGVYITTEEWSPMGEMNGEGWHCHLFRYSGAKTQYVRTLTDEIVKIFTVTELRQGAVTVTDPNVYFFLSLAMLAGPLIKEVYLAY